MVVANPAAATGSHIAVDGQVGQRGRRSAVEYPAAGGAVNILPVDDDFAVAVASFPL